MRGTGPNPGSGPRGRALLLIDLTCDRVRSDGSHPVGIGPQTLRFIEGELKYYRQRRRLVLHAYTLFAPDTTASQTPVYNVKGTHGADPCPPFNPLPGEIIIEKQFDSAFMQTQLEHILKELGVHQLSIAGVETHGSIIATAKDARSNGLHVIVPDMCVADSDHALHLQALRSMQTQAI